MQMLFCLTKIITFIYRHPDGVITSGLFFSGKKKDLVCENVIGMCCIVLSGDLAALAHLVLVLCFCTMDNNLDATISMPYIRKHLEKL